MPGRATPPGIRPRPLAPPGSLGGDVARGVEAALDLFGDREHPPPGERSAAGPGPESFLVTSPEAREKLGRILAGEGAFVATGHQPVLFGGPLYVLYKALSAVRRAERREEESGRPTMAMFWIGSDDHDWDEIGTLRLLDPDNELREIRLPPAPGWEGRPAGPSPVPEGVDDVVYALAQDLPQSEFVDRYLKLLRDAYRPGRRLAEAFGELVAELVSPRPMALLDGAAPAVKRASAPFLRESLVRAAEERAAVERATDAVETAGYDVQMPVLDGASHVFVDADGVRERLYVEGDVVRRGRDGEPGPLAELLEELERRPEAFSPNVALRPVQEAWLLPVEEAVLGPSELSYWAQLTGLFALHGVSMPRPAGRRSWVVVEGKVGKVLDKLDADVDDVSDGGDALVGELVERSRPEAVRSALDDLRAAIGSSLQEVEGSVEEELPGIRASVGKTRGELFRAVSELERTVDERLEQRQQVVVRQIRKAATHLFPDGRPQERVLSPLYYLARYGESFVDAVDEATGRMPADTAVRAGAAEPTSG